MKRIVLHLLFVIGLLVTAVVAGIAVWFWMPLAASVSDVPMVFYLLSLLAVTFVVVLGTLLLGRLCRQNGFAVGIAAATVTILLSVAGQQWLFRPAHALLGIKRLEIMNDDQTRFWELSTGSRIAYLHFESDEADKPAIVWLHGGPGAYAVGMQSLHKVPQALADAGYSVYLYDQIGSGFSNRLDDPRDYTLERHLADLSAIQEEIGARQVILIGSSWGATLAAHYISRHPDRVAAAIFNAPGEIWPLTAEVLPSDHVISESDRREKEAIQLTIGPRFLLMSQIRLRNPALFRKLSSDSEWDAVMDDDINRFVLKRGFCESDRMTISVSGFGLFAHNYTNRDFQTSVYDSVLQLRENPLPVLLLRGECEFLSEAIVDQYRASFSNLLYSEIAGAGHFITIEKPTVFVNQAKEFLGRELEST